MTRLKATQVDDKLRSLPGWRRKGLFITKSFEFDDGIAALAEKLGHHPDIHIRWTTVRLEIQTHDEDGITALDIKLAAEIEKHRKKVG